MVWLPCLVLLAVTLPHLEQGDFRRDTGRYAAVGLYMWDGGQLLQPQLSPGTPYFNKPPLAFWIHGAFLKIFGRHLAVARVPAVLAALGVVVLSVLTARRLGSQSEALVSGLVLALTYEFFRRSREISLDFWQLLFVMLALYLSVTAAKTGRKGLLVWSGVPIGVALLCKPLVALSVVPIFAVWLVMLGRPKWIWLLVAGVVPLALLVAAPWHLYMWHSFGKAFTSRYLVQEVLERAQGRISTNPAFYYLRLLGQTFWPWLAIIALVIWQRSRHDRPQRAAARDLVFLGGSWSAYALLLISLFPDKKPNYALLVYPMLSWVVAAGLCRLPWRSLREWYRSGFRWLGPAAAVLLLTLSLAPIRFQSPPDREWQSLFQWMNSNSIEKGQIAAAHVDENDRCYFYIRRGWWPAARGSAGYLLQRRGAAWKPADEEPVLFRAGDLVVTGSAPAGAND